MKDLLVCIKNRTLDPKVIGREFFSRSFTDAEKREFLEAFLESERFEDLALAFSTGFIQEPSVSDFSNSIESHYFGLFLETAKRAGLSREWLFAPVIACFYAPSGNALYGWRESAKTFLIGEAYKDYDGVLELLTVYDKGYLAYSVLFEVDRPKTETVLTDRLFTSGNKKHDKTAIRRLLLKQKINFSGLFGSAYFDADIKTREAMVRLALVFKNDAAAFAFLESVRAFEKSKTIKSLIEKKERVFLKKKKSGELSLKDTLERQMILKFRYPAYDFIKRLEDEEFSALAERLFFSVYEGERLERIVVITAGKIYGLDNSETALKESESVGILHPLELDGEYGYLIDSEVKQPFKQVGRPFFTRGGYELMSSSTLRTEGTLTDAGTLNGNIKKLGFCLLSDTEDGYYSRAAFVLGGTACVIEFTAVDFSIKTAPVKFGAAKFCDAKRLISLKGKYYLEGVPSKRIAEVDERLYSEFIYALNRLGNRV